MIYNSRVKARDWEEEEPRGRFRFAEVGMDVGYIDYETVTLVLNQRLDFIHVDLQKKQNPQLYEYKTEMAREGVTFSRNWMKSRLWRSLVSSGTSISSSSSFELGGVITDW